jgi:hypothetical protein
VIFWFNSRSRDKPSNGYITISDRLIESIECTKTRHKQIDSIKSIDIFTKSKDAQTGKVLVNMRAVLKKLKATGLVRIKSHLGV